MSSELRLRALAYMLQQPNKVKDAGERCEWSNFCGSYLDELKYVASKRGHMGPYAIEALAQCTGLEVQNLVPYIPQNPNLQARYAAMNHVFNYQQQPPTKKLYIITTLSEGSDFESAQTFNHFAGM